MLERYDGKKLRLTTRDGLTVTGRAVSFPSGYALQEFGVEEESLLLRGTHYYLSDIAALDLLEERPEETPDCLSFVEKMFSCPCWVVDVLPERVPADAEGQYFAVEKYYRQPGRLSDLHRRQAEILLRLNCYDSMIVCFDGCENWEKDPEPEAFAARLSALTGGGFLRALFPARDAMIEIDAGDTYFTVFCGRTELLDRVRALAGAEGLFLWKGIDD